MQYLYKFISPFVYIKSLVAYSRLFFSSLSTPIFLVLSLLDLLNIFFCASFLMEGSGPNHAPVLFRPWIYPCGYY